ncbi:MAG: sodium-dependent transporter [Pirellulales bacterium]|nr:sodium-dependent transporter [Pirellulales bacterium]
MTRQNRPKEAWGSRLGVILAVMGSAVGLGNFLRFPGLAAQYEGGAFMIPYFISLLILGLPLAWVEWSLGRYGGSQGYNSTPGIYRSVWKSRIAPYCGVLAIIIPVMIYMFYVYIEGWCLAYSLRYLFGQMNLGDKPAAYENFFNNFVGMNKDGAAILSLGGWPLGSAVLFTAICFVINFILIYRGLAKGIEWFCRWAMPLLIVCAIVILIRVLTLGAPIKGHPEQNLVNGLGYMWNLDVTKEAFWLSLCNPQMWLEAAGQIFFSLSVGFGIVITYASYMKKDDDIALSSLTASSGNEFCEVVLGGLIIVPAAFIFLGKEFFAKPQDTFSLGFKTLPNVFDQMIFGQAIGFLFFFLLFLAAVTSSLSMLQPAIALLEEGLGLRRKASVAMLGFITAVGTALVVFFSKDLAVLDTIDFWVGTFCIFVLATFQVILYGWVLGVDRGFEELDRGAEIRIPRFVKFIIKYVSPTYLLVIFGLWINQQFFTASEDPEVLTWPQKIQQSPVVQMTLGFIVVVIILFLLLIAQSVRRWRAAERAETEAAP